MNLTFFFSKQRILLTVGALATGCALVPPAPEAVPPAPVLPVVSTPAAVPVPAAPAPVDAPAVIAAPAAAPSVPEEVVIAMGVLSDISRAMSAGGDSLRREIATTTATWAKTKTDAVRLKLAALTVVASAGPADDQRALSLLEPWYGKSAEPSSYKAVADLIIIPLIEKQKSMREQQKQLDAQKERADSLKKELDQTTAKLDALRQLERNLGNRRRTP
jgi:hypothetical protein